MIAIIPAAGSATRMMGLPKAFLPIPGNTLIGALFERVERETRRIVIGANGTALDLANRFYSVGAKTFAAHTLTMSETVLLSRDYADPHEQVLFAMPDAYIEDADVFRKLRRVLDQGADVAVAVAHIRPGQHREGGMVYVDGDGRITHVIDKPVNADTEWIWCALAWRPAFWDCMRTYDPHVGFALPRALDEGLDVRPVFLDGQFFDCGTPERYFNLIRHLTLPPVTSVPTRIDYGGEMI